jgi:hypothetical protein
VGRGVKSKGRCVQSCAPMPPTPMYYSSSNSQMGPKHNGAQTPTAPRGAANQINQPPCFLFQGDPRFFLYIHISITTHRPSPPPYYTWYRIIQRCTGVPWGDLNLPGIALSLKTSARAMARGPRAPILYSGFNFGPYLTK